MKNKILSAAALILLGILAAPLQAAPAAVVDAVQAPAWLERDGRAVPLAAGAELRSRDRIRTGEDARVYMRLADGSTVKLGAQALADLERLGPREQGFFGAALDITQGAFRYTTDRFARPMRRDVTIRVATVTAGIRGTDLWGRSEPDKDFICLLEGRIAVSHRDGDAQEMSEPLSYYVARRNGAQPGIAAASPELVRMWAGQTEIRPGAGSARRGGKWKVLLATVQSQEEALDAYDRARAAGYATAIRPRVLEGGITYEVLLPGLPDRAEAAALAQKAGQALGLAAAPTR